MNLDEKGGGKVYDFPMENPGVALYLLDASSLPLDDLSLLYPEERERFARFRKDQDKALFLGGRLLVRHYVGPGKLEFRSEGKPFLPNGKEFSLSHAYPFVVLAVSSSPVGVDVESLSRLENSPVKEFYPASDLEEYPDAGELWCLKEAAFKCRGEGYFNPKEPLHKQDEDSFLFLDGPYYFQKTVREGYCLAVVSKGRFEANLILVQGNDLLSHRKQSPMRV